MVVMQGPDYKYGYIDTSGNIVISAQYDYAYSFSEGLAAVNRGGEQPVFSPFRGGKWGFIEKSGAVVIPFEYEGARSFSEGLAPVKKDGKWGYIDQDENIVIPFRYDMAYSFRNGLASVNRGGYVRDEYFCCGEWGYIDKNDRVVVDFRESWFSLSDPGDLIPVRMDGIWGYKDRLGANVVIHPNREWEEAEGFSDGLGKVKINGKYGFINAHGELVIDATFDKVGDFHNGFAVIYETSQEIVVEGTGENTCSKLGYIDKAGRCIVKPQYDWAYEFVDGVARVSDQTGYYFVNTQGHLINRAPFDYAEDFSEGLGQVRTSAGCGFINATGEFAIPPRFYAADPFRDGFARVRVDVSIGDWGFIDKSGEVVIPPRFDSVNDFSEGLAIYYVPD